LFIGISFVILVTSALALAYALGARPTEAGAQSPSAELTKDMRACLARSWFPVVLASTAKPKLHADDKGDDPSVLWGRILDSCDVRPNEESAATDYVKSLMESASPSGAPKAEAPEPEKKAFDTMSSNLEKNRAVTDPPKAGSKREPIPAVQFCGPDHWVKDHWEPSCH